MLERTFYAGDCPLHARDVTTIALSHLGQNERVLEDVALDRRGLCED